MRKPLVCLLVVAACQREEATPTAPQAAPPIPTVAPTMKSEADDQNEKMRNCPVTLEGVTTEITDVDGGVQLAMRATEASVVVELRSRAAKVEKRANRGGGGGGSGGGGMRNCPVVVTGTTIVATEIKGGVQLVVKPKDGAGVDELRATTRDRYARAPIQRARLVREESNDDGDTRLFAGSVADLDGDGTLELVAGGFMSSAAGRVPTVKVYRQNGEVWKPLSEVTWDVGAGSLVRNIEIADLDADGQLEVIAHGRVGPAPHDASVRTAAYVLVDGALAQRTEVVWKTGIYAHGYGLAIGDLDGDRKPEVIVGGYTFDGTLETGWLHVYHYGQSAKGGSKVFTTDGTVSLDGQGDPQMRVNDITIGNVDGDDANEIVVAGRHGPLKGPDSKDLTKRREHGDLSVLDYSNHQLVVSTRTDWLAGSSARFRSVALANLDADKALEIVTGGQYDATGKSALVTYDVVSGKLVVLEDLSTTTDGVTGEVKDIVTALQGNTTRVLVTGAMGSKPVQHGDVTAWRIEAGKLVRDMTMVSKNGEETRARAAVLVPAKTGTKVITIGFARNSAAIVGQLLEWKL